jgi:hypothetical protein
MSSHQQRISELFVLNIALQLFDGVATYQGLHFGWREGNPILAFAFVRFGVGVGLLLSKAAASGLLVVLSYNRAHPIVAPALYFLAAVYSVMSLFPWLAKYCVLLVQTL